jgi:DNA-binding NarL/FixJ family response regulator
MIKILIADDHKLVREGLKSVLTSMATDIEIAGEASSGQGVIDFLVENSADVVLMDIDMPQGNGIETTHYLTKHYPEVRVLMLTMAENEKFVRESLEAGAQGYLLKSAGSKEILHAIRAVAEGEEYFSADLTRMLLSKEKNTPAATAAATRAEEQKIPVHLSVRELEVLQLIAQGYTNGQIADITFTSKRTIETHRQHLLEKTGCNNTATLIRFAATHDLLE